MTEKQTAEAIVTIATRHALESGLPADRIAATYLEAGCHIMFREVGVLGAATVLRQMADRLELSVSDPAGSA